MRITVAPANRLLRSRPPTLSGAMHNTRRVSPAQLIGSALTHHIPALGHVLFVERAEQPDYGVVRVPSDVSAADRAAALSASWPAPRTGPIAVCACHNRSRSEANTASPPLGIVVHSPVRTSLKTHRTAHPRPGGHRWSPRR